MEDGDDVWKKLDEHRETKVDRGLAYKLHRM